MIKFVAGFRLGERWVVGDTRTTADKLSLAVTKPQRIITRLHLCSALLCFSVFQLLVLATALLTDFLFWFRNNLLI